ncbi:MAG: tRNA adenosine(34) deaminase TadA [Natronospirillum sp.]|uniref:tRNA adenosine(34) deaminase TadA n=1 Tax=Natronospirillum sp. TaxID=2812955 RepID=UPI0025F41B80|nr:tRNA adenosine(34) deaminase TadA [Natronospirillum sp.]MCH8553038.1 tRNA adenosine(34) deaminase TadA [Natronospirillum sp.]
MTTGPADDQYWMRRALAQAEQGAAAGEVPVGAVLVRIGEGTEPQLLAEAHNAPLTTHDPTGHAEVRVLRAAGELCANYRLPDTTLYVTIEPCAMCVGALVHARVARVVFGAREPKAGALVSREQLSDKTWLNHQPDVTEGVLADEASALISLFFRSRRAAQKAARARKPLES